MNDFRTWNSRSNFDLLVLLYWKIAWFGNRKNVKTICKLCIYINYIGLIYLVRVLQLWYWDFIWSLCSWHWDRIHSENSKIFRGKLRLTHNCIRQRVLRSFSTPHCGCPIESLVTKPRLSPKKNNDRKRNYDILVVYNL